MPRTRQRTRHAARSRGGPATDADLLLSLGLSVTPGRLAVLARLATAPALVCARALYEQLRGTADAVGLATVYRTLATLTEAGVLHTFALDGEVCYRRCGSVHHHHIVCLHCRRVWEDRSAPVEQWVAEAIRSTGARLVDHRADVFVVCRTCDDIRRTVGEPASRAAAASARRRIGGRGDQDGE